MSTEGENNGRLVLSTNGMDMDNEMCSLKLTVKWSHRYYVFFLLITWGGSDKFITSKILQYD